MIDHHVDRPGVNVRQRIELTGPNRSTGFLLAAPILKRAADERPRKIRSQAVLLFRLRAGGAPDPRRGGFDDLVAMARGEAPDPISNSAVKTLSADGTA